MQKSFRWGLVEGPGIELLTMTFHTEGVLAQGMLVGESEGQAYGLAYSVSVDTQWQTRQVDISSPAGGPALRIQSDGNGHWHDAISDRALPALDGCIDVDIAGTPFTNTLPIRRHEWLKGQSRDFSMAYVSVPELEPSARPQRYTCLKSGKRFLFESIGENFQAELSIDEDGIVIDYSGLFYRIV